MTWSGFSVPCDDCGARHSAWFAPTIVPFAKVPLALKSLAMAGWLSWDGGSLCPACSRVALRAYRSPARSGELLAALVLRRDRARPEVS